MGSSNSRPTARVPSVADNKTAAAASAPPQPAVVVATDDTSSPEFVVSVQLPHKRVELALPQRHREVTPTVGCLHEEVARQEGVNKWLFTVHTRGEEVHWSDQPLERGAEYAVVAFPIFRELPKPADDGDDHQVVDAINVKALPKLLAELCRNTRPDVHVWRASPSRSERKWIDLVVEGPSSSPYDGGAFVLRVVDEERWMMGCSYHYLTLRLVTPLYHPTVGPSGRIALWRYQEWGSRQKPWEIISAFVNQLELDVPPILHQSMQKELPSMKEMLEEWTALGPAGAAAKARLWTWHYATAHGRAYRRSRGRCTGLAILASLIKADPQVRSEVRQVLLVANRQHRQREEDVNASRPAVLASLPTELLHGILMVVGSGRQPPAPPSADWALAREDDRLPVDWRARLSPTPRSK